MSKADVSGAFGKQFLAGSKASAYGEIDNECMFSRGDLGQTGLVLIELVSGEMASHFYTHSQQLLTGTSPVSGVGDKALQAQDGTTILAIKGQIAVFVAALISGKTAAELGSGCMLLARLVFSKTH